MFKIGDKIIYGKTGVCEVIEIKEMSMTSDGKKELYYNLKPIYQQGSTIFTPVNNNKIAMRSIITKSEALKLIKQIPKIQAKPFSFKARRDVVEYYEKTLNSLDYHNLIELAVTIYEKKQDAEKNKKAVSSIDEKFMKKAEELLFVELAAVLSVDKNEIPALIEAEKEE